MTLQDKSQLLSYSCLCNIATIDIDTGLLRLQRDANEPLLMNIVSTTLIIEK